MFRSQFTLFQKATVMEFSCG
uniref:Uncharacterized protein n=1 Tax=Rhizophora mucronata TaxID=61149 RepID=A0A2P2P1F8_RHIMU